MSFVTVATDAVAEAVKTLEGIGSGLSAARTAAAAPTAGIAAAAQDEVSTAIAGLLGNFGREFQAVSAQAQAFHDRFVSTLGAGMGQYASAEAANVQQTWLNAVNAPAASILPAAAVSFPVVNYPTALGPILLTLYGEQSLLGMVTVTAGSLYVPTPLALAYDAISPVANVMLAVRDGNTAFASAVQTGNALGAATAIVQTPFNAVGGFFFGGGSITGGVGVPAATGYTGMDYRIPVGGLFSPVSPVVLTLHGSDGTTTVLPLRGTQFGGIFGGIGSAITSAITGS
jgi:hypothetical protein